MAEIAHQSEQRLDLALGIVLGLAATEHELRGDPAAIELEQLGELGAVGFEDDRFLALGRTGVLAELGDFSSLISERPSSALELKKKYLPTWAADGLKLYRWLGVSPVGPVVLGTMYVAVASVMPSTTSEPSSNGGPFFWTASTLESPTNVWNATLSRWAKSESGELSSVTSAKAGSLRSGGGLSAS